MDIAKFLLQMYTVSSLVNNKKVPNESVALLALNTRCKKLSGEQPGFIRFVTEEVHKRYHFLYYVTYTICELMTSLSGIYQLEPCKRKIVDIGLGKH